MGEEHSTDDPAAAFDALRRSVEDQNTQLTLIRKGLELALDQMENAQKTRNYSDDLIKVQDAFKAVAGRLKAIEEAPALNNRPDQLLHTMQRAGENLFSNSITRLESQAKEFEQKAAILTRMVKSAKERSQQDMRLWIAGCVGVVAGITLAVVIVPFIKSWVG